MEDKFIVFEKKIVMSLIKFFTVHEYKGPVGSPDLELVERDLNKQLMTWDMDVASSYFSAVFIEF